MDDVYFGRWAVHGDIYPNGLSLCAFCDLFGDDHDHEHFVTPNGVDRYRWGLFRNARENVSRPEGIQNVVQPLADRTIEEDDEHWVRWALKLTVRPPRSSRLEREIRERFGVAKLMFWREREVYKYIHEHAWCPSRRSRKGLRRLPTHEVVGRILSSIPLEPAT